MKKDLTIKRIYEYASGMDGYRILVDRIWPRGVSKEDANLDKWWKEIAPSDKIRKAFDHESDKFDTFKQNYIHELDENNETKSFLQEVNHELKSGRVTLLYGAKDETHNQAVVLKDYIERHKERSSHSQDKEFYQKIGEKGGKKTSKTHDTGFYQKIGKKGGEATSDSHTKEFYEEIGKKGGESSQNE